MKIEDLDKNFKVKTNIKREDLEFYSGSSPLFLLYGIKYDNEVGYYRIDYSIAESIAESIRYFAPMTAGGRIRFKTNSPFIAIAATMPKFKLPHMADIGTTGFDLIIKEETDGKVKTSVKILPPTEGREDGVYESFLEFPDKKERDLTLSFPLYNHVDKLFIGLQKGAKIEKAKEYKYKDVIFYGSSITQGACADRPSSSYEALLSDALDFDYLNLGFSGNAKGETKLAEYIASLSMSLFVYDYDHNAPNSEFLEKTHEPFFKIIREKNKDLPVIMLSRPDFKGSEEDKRRRRVVKKTYMNAKKAGDNNVYFIDGETIFGKLGVRYCSTDETHPNDFGMYRFYKRLYPIMKKILEQS